MRIFGDRRLRLAVAILAVASLVGLSLATLWPTPEVDGLGIQSPIASTSPSAETTPSQPPEPELLDRGEAKATFTRLHDIAQTLSEHRDAGFLANVFTSDGPMLQRAATRITELLQDQVIDRSQIKLRSVKIRSLEPDTVRLLVDTTTTPCLVKDSGEDVTGSERRLVKQSVLWTMKWELGRWKLHDAELRDQRLAKAEAPPCAREGG